MRVALLNYDAQAGDAIGNQVARKLRFFRARGADVRVYVESAKRLHPDIALHATIVPSGRPTAADSAYLASADLVVVEYGLSYRLLSCLPLLARGQARIAVNYHGVTPAELWGRAHAHSLRTAAAHRRMILFAEAAFTDSDFTRRELIRVTGMPAERVTCIGLPIDHKRFHIGVPRRDLRERLALDRARVLLFVGRVAPHKRVPVLVDALAQLRGLDPPVHVVVIGDTSDLFETEKDTCLKRAAEHGVADRLHFLGPVTDDELLDAYRSADALVMPSRHEGFCVPVVEAMACGVPVIAARAAALPETVGNAGLLFNPDDAADLAAQIKCVLELGVAKQLSELAVMRAAAFSDARWEERFANLVDQILHQPPRIFFENVEVRPRHRSRRVSTDLDCLLLPVELINRGSHPLAPDGEARWVLQAQMTDESGRQVGETTVPTPLSGILPAGASEDFLIAVPIPAQAGRYQIEIRAEQPDLARKERPVFGLLDKRPQASVARVRLAVKLCPRKQAERLRERVETLLAEADGLKRLPDDYLDVTEGWLAGLKRRIKAKLLGNFRRAYVDVLSRQQSAFNQNMLAAVHELTELQSRLEESLQRLEEARAADTARRPRRRSKSKARERI